MNKKINFRLKAQFLFGIKTDTTTSNTADNGIEADSDDNKTNTTFHSNPKIWNMTLIGNANPNALLLANNCFNAVNVIGMPEGRIILSQCVTYLASSAKSNASYMAIENAFEVIEKTGDLPVPMHLRNAPTKLMKELGYGDEYAYAHHFDNNFVNLEFFPESLAGTTLYEPGNNPREAELRQFLRLRWKEKYGY